MGISGKKCIILHPEIPNMMSYPIGQSDCKLDSKGRLMVPASFKEQLGALCDEGFVMHPGLFFVRRESMRIRPFFLVPNSVDRKSVV